MKLFINCSDPVEVQLGLISDSASVFHSFKTDYSLSEKLIIEIKKFLTRQKFDLHKIKLIEVVVGPGHFSRIRTAVATANALAFGLNIKIIPVRAGLRKSARTQALVKPFYSKQPNISKPKHLT